MCVCVSVCVSVSVCMCSRGGEFSEAVEYDYLEI